MSKRGQAEIGLSGNPAGIKLETVTPLWLDAECGDRYLLLEDAETGDVLLPLIYMKAILEANYSRKLASLKNRLVTVPPGSVLARANRGGALYWQWAFEAPQAVKAVCRKELGEDNTPQGHLRLVLLPIVYNALSQRPDLRGHPLFRALHRVLQASTYWPLLRALPASLSAELAATGCAPQRLFGGPRSVEECAVKYMFVHADEGGGEPGGGGGGAEAKRPRSAAAAAAEPDGDGTPSLGRTVSLPDALGGGSGGGATGGGLSADEVTRALLARPATGLPAGKGGAAGAGDRPGASPALDPAVADAVAAAVEARFAELSREVGTIRACMVQLYSAVNVMMAAAARPGGELPRPPPLGAPAPGSGSGGAGSGGAPTSRPAGAGAGAADPGAAWAHDAVLASLQAPAPGLAPAAPLSPEASLTALLQRLASSGAPATLSDSLRAFLPSLPLGDLGGLARSVPAATVNLSGAGLVGLGLAPTPPLGAGADAATAQPT